MPSADENRTYFHYEHEALKVNNQALFIRVRLFEVACASWALPRPFNGHSLHGIPALPPTKQSQELSLPPSDRHHLCHSPPHPCTRMVRLLPQRGLDLFKIR